MVKNKLIAARKEKNRIQSDLADLLFINQSQYQRWESGEIHISDEEWVRIAKFLEKEVNQIKEEADYTINQYFTLTMFPVITSVVTIIIAIFPNICSKTSRSTLKC